MKKFIINIFNKVKTFWFNHKKLSIIILVLIVGLSSYLIFKKSSNAETRYITYVVEKGNVVSTITGSGQVEALNSIDLKAKASADITGVYVKAGDVVKKGKLLFALDSRDAQ